MRYAHVWKAPVSTAAKDVNLQTMCCLDMLQPVPAAFLNGLAFDACMHNPTKLANTFGRLPPNTPTFAVCMLTDLLQDFQAPQSTG